MRIKLLENIDNKTYVETVKVSQKIANSAPFIFINESMVINCKQFADSLMSKIGAKNEEEVAIFERDLIKRAVDNSLYPEYCLCWHLREGVIRVHYKRGVFSFYTDCTKIVNNCLTTHLIVEARISYEGAVPRVHISCETPIPTKHRNIAQESYRTNKICFGAIGMDYDVITDNQLCLLCMYLLVDFFVVLECAPKDYIQYFPESKLMRLKERNKVKKSTVFYISHFSVLPLAEIVKREKKAHQGGTVIPHWRRGHYRRVRTKRGFKVRFIPAVMVNANKPADIIPVLKIVKSHKRS